MGGRGAQIQPGIISVAAEELRPRWVETWWGAGQVGGEACGAKCTAWGDTARLCWLTVAAENCGGYHKFIIYIIKIKNIINISVHFQFKSTWVLMMFGPQSHKLRVFTPSSRCHLGTRTTSVANCQNFFSPPRRLAPSHLRGHFHSPLSSANWFANGAEPPRCR